MKYLVTAGPTREPIDPVRFLSNRSTGKMGYAVARAAAARGHEVCLVTGPVALASPDGVEVEPVVTAEDMCRAVTARVAWCDVLVMAAAVADWRPASEHPQKWKKGRASTASLHLVRTPDILASIRDRKAGRVFVGFAAETENVDVEAERKLREKGLDAIVANDVSRGDAGFESDTNQVVFMHRDGTRKVLPLMSKDLVAIHLLDFIERC